MAHFSVTIEVDASPERAFAFLADPMNRARWDPSVRRVEPADDHYDVTLGFYGKAIEVTYTVSELVEPSRIVFTTGGKVTGRDVIDIVARDGGSSITLDMTVELKGPARLLDRGLQLAFAGIGENAAAGVAKSLAG